MTSAFPKHIEQALDSYEVPAMSADFTDRLLAKAMAQAANDGQETPSRRWNKSKSKSKASPWRRGGYIASGIVGFGMVSAAAAAALSLADIPVKIPIVSDWVERVLPTALAKTENVQDRNDAEFPVIEESATVAEVSGEDSPEEPKRWRDLERAEKAAVIRERVATNEARVQERRAERGLPPLTKKQLQRRRTAIRARLAKPETRRPLIRRALRQKARERARTEGQPLRNRPDITQIDNNETTTKTAVERLPITSSEPEDINAIDSGTKAPDTPATGTEADPVDQGQVASEQIVSPELKPTMADRRAILREKLPDAAKERWKNASPAERRRLLRNAKTRRKKASPGRSPRQRLRDLRRRRK